MGFTLNCPTRLVGGILNTGYGDLVLEVVAAASTLDKQSVYNYMSHLALSNEIVHNGCKDACVKLLNPCPDCATEQIRA